MDDYAKSLNDVKQFYPFETRWMESGKNGLDQYSPENCRAVQGIFDGLIAEMIALGADAPEEKKVELIQGAVVALNDLNDDNEGALIETSEREELCSLFDHIISRAGIDPENYDGEVYGDRDW